MPDVRSRRTAVVVASLAALVILATVLPTATAAKEPPGIASFMRAMGQVESGGRYTARNPSSGAYGKYQIMPYMWRAWARVYFGNANLRPTPVNQERLAKAVMTRAYWKFDSWPVVAHYWLTGRGERDRRTWSTYARRYVAKVMGYYRQYGGASGSGSKTPARSWAMADSNPRIDYEGAWAVAGHASYAGGKVTWSKSGGASATLEFTGTSIALYGPTGPTRGRLQVFIDGRYRRTVDLYSSGFRPRERLFATYWASAAPHTLKVVVAGTAARPVVALDSFVVGLPRR